MDDASDPYAKPPHVSDETVRALGMLSEAREWTERARGNLYAFHQMTGHADALLGRAADALAEAGHTREAERLRQDFVGRNVLHGRWTFQVVDEYDATYWGPLREAEAGICGDLADGRPHLHEAAMKEARRTRGAAHHERRPGPSD